MKIVKLSVYLIVGFHLWACKKAGSTLEESPAIATASTYYQEPHRPQYHFSPQEMWMNDPNGMVYFDGEYHLFYQHYPDSNVWGPMHWGHAVSTDLMHWKHLPIALFPDKLGYIFSGSAVVDWNNTSGFGAADSPALVAIYTYHDPVGAEENRDDFQTQGIAYSTDRGRSWVKYDGNPVIPNPGIKDFRDPKVIWHEATEQWVMIFAAYDHVKIYNSPDLKDWQLVSEFGKDQGSHGGVWECPDLFPLADNEGNEKWVMIVSLGDGAPNGGSGTQYFIGDFDGTTFTNSNPKEEILWLDYGRDNYAGVTWSDVPEEDGRRIFLGWMSNWKYAQVVPTEVWRSAMTLPRTLQLRNTPEGLRVVSNPVTEVDNLQGPSQSISPQILAAGEPLAIESAVGKELCVLDLKIKPGDAANFIIEWSNVENQRIIIGYDVKNREFYTDRRASGKSDFSDEFTGVHTAPRISTDETVALKLYLDVSSVEVFADGGEVVLTDLTFPNTNYHRLRLLSENASTEILEGQITELRSVWSEE